MHSPIHTTSKVTDPYVRNGTYSSMQCDKFSVNKLTRECLYIQWLTFKVITKYEFKNHTECLYIFWVCKCSNFHYIFRPRHTQIPPTWAYLDISPFDNDLIWALCPEHTSATDTFTSASCDGSLARWLCFRLAAHLEAREGTVHESLRDCDALLTASSESIHIDKCGKGKLSNETKRQVVFHVTKTYLFESVTSDKTSPSNGYQSKVVSVLN